MIKTENIKGNIFLAQTTYYVYASKEARESGKSPVFVTSNKEEFEEMKQRVKDTNPIPEKGFKL